VFDSEKEAAKMYDMYARAKGFYDQALNVTRFPELGKK
jgi:prephenate dehydratase